jgi:hypothetical protein
MKKQNKALKILPIESETVALLIDKGFDVMEIEY